MGDGGLGNKHRLSRLGMTLLRRQNEVLVLAPTGNAASNLGRMFKAYWLECCSTGSSQKRAFNSCEVSQGQQHNAVYRGDRHSQFQTVALDQPAVQRHIVWDTCLSHQVFESWLCPLLLTARFGAWLAMQLPYLHGKNTERKDILSHIEYTVPYMSSCRGRFVGLSHYASSM